MYWLDWVFVGIFLALFVPLFARNGKNRQEGFQAHFAGGHRISWFWLGGSMAASKISSDTPLLVSGAFYEEGLRGNLFWLAGIPGVLATLFFFARYWRRSGVLTEIEILDLRYGDSPKTRNLRSLMALFHGVLINLLVLTSVTYAAYRLFIDVFGLSPDVFFEAGPIGFSSAGVAVALLMLFTSIYTLISGFGGVVRTDLAQLAVAVVACMIIAGMAIVAGIGESGSYMHLLNRIPNREHLFSLFDMDDPSSYLLFLFAWWHRAPGDGIFVQRFIAAKTEKDATLTAFWYIILHYCVRAWSWFFIGALGLIYFEGLAHPEMIFTLMTERFVPVGGTGLLLVAFWAAYMSTVDSRLNWGASYVVNDCLKPVFPEKLEKLERPVEILTIGFLAVMSVVLVLTSMVTSFLAIYKYLLVVEAGLGLVAILRWYWWRMTIEGEISGFIASLIIGNLLVSLYGVGESLVFCLCLAANLVLSGSVGVIVSIVTGKSVPTLAARNFHGRTGMPGPGWCPLADGQADGPGMAGQLALWFLSVVLIYAIIVFLSALFTGQALKTITALLVMTVSGGILVSLRKALFVCLGFRD